MDDRLLPDEFLRSYREVVGGNPPREFLEAYSVLAESLYFGTGLEYSDAGYSTGGRQGFERGYDFGEPRLLRFKWAVDRRLAALAEELRSWTVAREGEEAGGPVPVRDRDRSLGGSRVARDHVPNREA